jgi:uncharacterized protein (UPF0332 family)
MNVSEDNAILSRKLIEKSKQIFEDVIKLKEIGGSCLSISNRLYYSLFYMVNALLILKGLTAKKHSGIRSLFDLHFVKTGIVDKKYGQIFKDIQKTREESDYDYFYIIEKEKTEKDFVKAKEFIDYIENIINIYIENNHEE